MAEVVRDGLTHGLATRVGESYAMPLPRRWRCNHATMVADSGCVVFGGGAYADGGNLREVVSHP